MLRFFGEAMDFLRHACNRAMKSRCSLRNQTQMLDSRCLNAEMFKINAGHGSNFRSPFFGGKEKVLRANEIADEALLVHVYEFLPPAIMFQLQSGRFVENHDRTGQQ